MMSPSSRGWDSSLPLSTRGDSFDVAASSVVGVPLQQQTSFDHQYSFFDPQIVKSEQQPVEEVGHRPDTAVSFAPGIAYCEDHQAGRPLSRQLPFNSRSIGDKRSGTGTAQRSTKQSKLNDQSECCLSVCLSSSGHSIDESTIPPILDESEILALENEDVYRSVG